MIEVWSQCGLCQNGFNGPTGISWAEINAYSQLNGTLTAWESEQVYLMSKSYVSGYYDGKEQMSAPPYERDDEDYVAAKYAAIERMVDATMEVPD